MIHSLSGGVLADFGTYTFVKVYLEGTPRWYLAPMGAEAGDVVIVPLGRETCEAEVVRVENCSAQCAPVPMNRIREVVRLIKKAEKTVDISLRT